MRYPERNDSIACLECWKFEEVHHAKENINYRNIQIADQPRRTATRSDVEDRLERWLQLKVSVHGVFLCSQLHGIDYVC